MGVPIDFHCGPKWFSIFGTNLISLILHTRPIHLGSRWSIHMVGQFFNKKDSTPKWYPRYRLYTFFRKYLLRTCHLWSFFQSCRENSLVSELKFFPRWDVGFYFQLDGPIWDDQNSRSYQLQSVSLTLTVWKLLFEHL